MKVHQNISPANPKPLPSPLPAPSLSTQHQKHLLNNDNSSTNCSSIRHPSTCISSILSSSSKSPLLSFTFWTTMIVSIVGLGKRPSCKSSKTSKWADLQEQHGTTLKKCTTDESSTKPFSSRRTTSLLKSKPRNWPFTRQKDLWFMGTFLGRKSLSSSSRQTRIHQLLLHWSQDMKKSLLCLRRLQEFTT